MMVKAFERRAAGLVTGFTLLCSARAAAQLPSASTAALGLGENFTAAARSFNAVAWNPALLGLPGNPRSAVTLAPVRIVSGLDPVSFGDLSNITSRTLSGSIKASWLSAVEASGSEQGSGGADVTFLAAQFARFALQVSTRALATSDLPPGAVELLLYGKESKWQPKPSELRGSRLDGFAASTFAASYAVPIHLTDGHVALGATLKYTMGHLLVYTRGPDSTMTSNVTLPSISTLPSDSSNGGLNNGSGLGLDIGVALQKRNLTLSGVVQNVYNDFRWRSDALVYRPAGALFKDTISEDEPFGDAPERLQTAVKRLKYRPVVAAGLAVRMSARLLVDLDMRTRLGDEGMQDEPDFHVGAGVEYRVRPFLPLRVGGGLINEGHEFGSGVGFELGGFSLGASVMRRVNGFGSSTVAMLTLLSTSR